MQNTKIILLIALVVIAGIGVLGYFALSDSLRDNTEKGEDKQATTSISDNSLNEGKGSQSQTVNIDGEPLDPAGIEYTSLVENTSIPIPNIDRAIVFESSIDPDYKAFLEKNAENQREELRKEPYSYPNWLELALQYNAANDYEGARIIWEYINEASPNQSISFSNVGKLYHFDMPNFPKAEENMLKAIERNPGGQDYFNLYELYKFSYKTETNLAEQTLIDGLEVNPGDVVLSMALGNLYMEAGRNQEAIDIYTKTRVHAQLIGNTGLVEQIDKLIERLGN